ncbi:hypothetical protein APICC_09814 [Apis cerana cerana]|uniref:Uncharacterized protein n=1 Tax=Apis cerana cerana TaxID=94128 RepID=A0A2A3EGV9_APICC|nr:hypothetical protein APICC_09814 [Apis cerana cerana]
MLNTPILCESNLSLYLKALALSDNGALILNYAVGIAKSHFIFVNNLFMVKRKNVIEMVSWFMLSHISLEFCN